MSIRSVQDGRHYPWRTRFRFKVYSHRTRELSPVLAATLRKEYIDFSATATLSLGVNRVLDVYCATNVLLYSFVF